MASSEQHRWNTDILLWSNMGASASFSICVSEFKSGFLSLSHVLNYFLNPTVASEGVKKRYLH